MFTQKQITSGSEGSIVALVSEPKTIPRPSFPTLGNDKSCTGLAITSATSEYQVNSCLECSLTSGWNLGNEKGFISLGNNDFYKTFMKTTPVDSIRKSSILFFSSNMTKSSQGSHLWLPWQLNVCQEMVGLFAMHCTPTHRHEFLLLSLERSINVNLYVEMTVYE